MSPEDEPITFWIIHWLCMQYGTSSLNGQTFMELALDIHNPLRMNPIVFASHVFSL